MPVITHRKTLEINLKLAKVFGLCSYPTKPWSTYIALTLFRTVNIIITTLVIIANTADFFINIDDLMEVSYNIGYILPMVTTSLKAATIWIHQKAFLQLLDDVHSPVVKLTKTSDSGVMARLKSAIFYGDLDFKIFSFALTAICLTGLLPVKIILRDRQLVIRAVFPFDEKPYPIFEIVYAVQYYGLVILCLWCLTFDPAAMGIVRWMTFQMDILGSNFERCEMIYPRSYFLDEPGVFESTSKEINCFVPFSEEEVNVKKDSFLLRFCECIKHHRRLIHILDDFNSLFGVVLFAQIASDCLLTCIGLFQMALAIRKRRNIFRDLVMLGSGLIHLGYWAVYGNLLILQQEKLVKSIYECGWENNISKKMKPAVVFGIFQGLTPMVISAGYFFVFSMETYLSVIQKAYSYFAILNTMME